jgi:hypothetical protein
MNKKRSLKAAATGMSEPDEFRLDTARQKQTLPIF